MTQLTPSYITTANICLRGESWNGEMAALKPNLCPSQLMDVNHIAGNTNPNVRCVTAEKNVKTGYKASRAN
jgi:hypothetical protein